MKRKNIYILGVITLLILSSCESLDLEVRTTLSALQVEKNYTRTSNHCAAVYNFLQEGFASVGGAMMACACDEAEYTLETSNVQKFNTGAWNPFDNPNDVWGRYYRGIRLANDFLVMSDSVNLEVYRMDPAASQQTLYQTRLAEIKRWKYEVRFLRAFFYFELVKRYGGVPIVTSAISPKENFSGVSRNTLADCIKFITDECDSAAGILPLNYSAVVADFGRATKGAALALKSRVLLYVASDLFNTPPASYAYTELVSMPPDVSRTARWQAAADAALAVINLAATAPYSLSTASATAYRSLFQTYNNNEIIFTRRNDVSNSFEMANYPIGFDLGNSGTTPSQNLVDAYEVKVNATTSVPFDWSNPVHAANPYAPVGLSRDPRLGMSIITNNSTYKSRAIECWTGGKDGQGVTLATKTGYYLKKYVDENLNLLTGTKSVHSWIFFRYAEILLNYAEALNEAQGPIAAVYTNVNLVRARTGVSMPALPAGLTQAQMRDKIRNECRVEFAFEDHRAWDVRRWMLGDTYFNSDLRGVAVTQTAPGVFTYQPITVEQRVFDVAKMYLYPIPQSELNIMKGWKQNPGW
jgi:hypothetical protein